MDKKVLDQCLEFLHAKPRPAWGKLVATLRVNNVKEIAGRNWRHYDHKGLELLLEIEQLKQPKPKAKKASAKVEVKKAKKEA
jgi:hypothetical protein